MTDGTEPKIRNGICMDVNPEGLVRGVARQIAQARALPRLATPPKSVLVLGCSGGYGLSARIVAAYAGGAATLGVSFERQPEVDRAGTPGWYNNEAFDAAARADGLKAATLVADAFLPESKQAVIERARADGFPPFDCVIYSLAAPMRKDPQTGEVYRSVLRPLGSVFHGQTINVGTGHVVDVVIKPGTAEEVTATVKVMGGEDWELWIRALADAGLLAKDVTTVAFSYIGPSCTQPIYRSGTLGQAKAHLERTAHQLTQALTPLHGRAYVSVNKALVTRASSVIPAMPPYIAALYRVMKEKGLHEGCFEQAVRLYRDRLYAGGPVPVDEAGRIRLDDWEMRSDVQEAVARLLDGLTTDNLRERIDFDGYRDDFLELHGFGG